jgi:hypothetical protein
MKNRSAFIAVLLTVALSFTLVDPLHIASGKYDSNPYTEIAQQLDQSSTIGVLVLASYADLYKFPIYKYLRDILGTRLAYHGEMVVEYGYEEVLGQASLGEKSFQDFVDSDPDRKPTVGSRRGNLAPFLLHQGPCGTV